MILHGCLRLLFSKRGGAEDAELLLDSTSDLSSANSAPPRFKLILCAGFASEASGNGFQNQPLRLSGLEKPSHPHKIGLTRRVTTNYQLSIRNQAKTKYFAFQAGPMLCQRLWRKSIPSWTKVTPTALDLSPGFSSPGAIVPEKYLNPNRGLIQSRWD